MANRTGIVNMNVPGSTPFFTYRWLPLLCVMLFPHFASGQAPVPQLQWIFPPGAKAGQTVDVNVASSDTPDGASLVFSHGGITASQKQTAPTEFDSEARPISGQFSVVVSPDTPPGIYTAIVVGRYGATNSRPFVVSASEELIEAAGNNSAKSAHPFPIGAVINGRCDAGAVDYYGFEMATGDVVTVSIAARRLASRLRPHLTVRDPNGKVVAVESGSDHDISVSFEARSAGKHTLEVRDAVYRGGAEYFYRLSRDPLQMESVEPLFVSSQPESQVVVLGRALKGGTAVENSPGLLRLDKRVADLAAPSPFELEGTLSALLEDARLVEVESAAGSRAKAGIVFVRSGPVGVESEPNDQPEKANKVVLPFQISGHFGGRKDVDLYEFEGQKGKAVWIEVVSARIGAATDPAMVIQRVIKQDAGPPSVVDLHYVDDSPERQNRPNDFDITSADPAFKFTPPEDGTYRLAIRDQNKPASNQVARPYLVSAREPAPSFRFVVHRDRVQIPPDPNVAVLQGDSVARGGAIAYRVEVERRDGFDGEIAFQVEGLSAGLRGSEAMIGGAVNTAPLSVFAADDAASGFWEFRVIGKAKIGDQEVIQKGVPCEMAWGVQNRQQDRPMFRPLQSLRLYVHDKEPGPAQVAFADSPIFETSLGGKIEIPVRLIKKAEFKGPVRLSRYGLPDLFQINDVNLDPNSSEGKVEVILGRQEIRPGTYSFFLRADSTISFARRPEFLAAVENQHKQFDTTLAQVNEATQKSNAAFQQADIALQQGVAMVQQAEQDRNRYEAQAKQKADQLNQAKEALRLAEEASKQDQQNADLARAAQERKAQLDTIANEEKSAQEQLNVANDMLKQRQEDAKVREKAKSEAMSQMQSEQERQKRANEFKQQLDQRLNQVRQECQPRDVPVAFPSDVVRLRVVASPMRANLPEVIATLKQGEKGNATISIERKYGFQDQVDVILEPPQNVHGLGTLAFPIPAGQNEARFEIPTQEQTPAGRYAYRAQLKSRFNNVGVETTGTTTLEVIAK